MGAHHSMLIDKVEGVTLHGVCDLLPEKRERALKEHPGIKTYSHIDEVLADKDVDVVSVVVPHNIHAKLAIQVMNAGKHAITDKAICLTVKDLYEMMAVRDKNSVLLSTFHNRRWDPEFITIQKLVNENTIGRLYHIDINITDWGMPGGWRKDRPQMGGWMFDWGAHNVDQILLLAKSKPTHVYAFDHYRMENSCSVEDFVECHITFDNGITATSLVSYISYMNKPRYQVIGEFGGLEQKQWEQPITMRTKVGGIMSDVSVPLQRGDWTSFYENIRDTILGKTELAVKPEQLLPQIAISEAAYKSIATKQVVIPEW